MRRVPWLAVFLCCLFLHGRSASAAQTPSSDPIRGRVLDASRAPVAGAAVVAAPEGGGPSFSTVTDSRGEFTLAIGPTAYTVKVTAPGFPGLDNATRHRRGPPTPLEIVLEVEGPRERSRSARPAATWFRRSRARPAPRRRCGDVPQSVSVVTRELDRRPADGRASPTSSATSPGSAAHQGENNRDQVIIRGNSSSADFFVNGVRDDVQYYRDLYNLDRLEALKGPNAMVFGRGGGGGVINRVTKEARLPAAAAGHAAGRRVRQPARHAAIVDQPLSEHVAVRLNGMYENSGSFRDGVDLERGAVNPTLTFAPDRNTKVTVGYEYLRDTRVADRGITSFQGRPVGRRSESTFYGNPDDSHVEGEREPRARCRRASRRPRARSATGPWSAATIAAYQNYVPGAVSADRSQVALTAYNNATDRTNVFNQTDLTIAASTGPDRRTRCWSAPRPDGQCTDNFRNTGFFNNTATSILVPFAAPTISDAGDLPAERHRRRQPRRDHRRRGVRAGPGRPVAARCR